eukprot:scaffold2168_cov161-Alexandrium_tamarense.AAC.2
MNSYSSLNTFIDMKLTCHICKISATERAVDDNPNARAVREPTTTISDDEIRDHSSQSLNEYSVR